MKRATLVLPAVLLAVATSAQDLRITVSSRAGDRLTDKPTLRFGVGKATTNGFRIDATVRHQTMEGFGAAFNEAGLISLNRLPAEEQERVLARIFDPERGAGLSLMKLDIGANDFMSAGPWYTYAEKPGDAELASFTIARDLGPNGVATFATRARRHGDFRLQVYMDYPPEWMLIDPTGFQDVDEKYFPALARYYLRYVEEYARHGLTIDFLSPFNEPGIYTKIPFTGRLEGVRCLAFATPDGGLVAQLLNSRPQPERTAVEWKGRTVVVDLPGRSLTTARWRD